MYTYLNITPFALPPNGTFKLQTYHTRSPAVPYLHKAMDIQSMIWSQGVVPRFHSETAYEIQPEERDGILRISAYHRKDFDFAVISFPPAHMLLFTPPWPMFHNPAVPLGELDRLPLELIHQVCLELDMASLFRFRQVNTRARQVVAALHEYRTVATHAPTLLCAVLQTRLAPYITLPRIYSLLCTRACELCGYEFGDIVHLPRWIRCCSSCLRRKDPGLSVATLGTAERAYELSRAEVKKITKISTVPGRYMCEELRTRRLTIVSRLSA